jgi:hypothetical protein
MTTQEAERRRHQSERDREAEQHRRDQHLHDEARLRPHVVWVRKRQVRARYGNCSDRTIDRMVEAGKLPPPQHPLRNKIPFWSLAELEASDRAAAAAYRNQSAT